MKRYNLSFECLVSDKTINVKQSFASGLYYFYHKDSCFGYFFKAGTTWFWYHKVMRRFKTLDMLFKKAGAEIESSI